MGCWIAVGWGGLGWEGVWLVVEAESRRVERGVVGYGR